MNINTKKYFDANSIDGFINRRRKYYNNKFGEFLFRIEQKFRHFIILGFGDAHSDYHLLSKLCRYKTWDDVKITWWDKIRFKIITGEKFNN